MKKAVVLLSGGLDSATALAWTLSKGYQAYALLFNYGQKHSKELTSAMRVARYYHVPYRKVAFSLPWKGSALLASGSKLPHSRSLRVIKSGGIPSTYVPARNTLFLSFALSYAEVLSAQAIVIGANAVDFSGYPDCRPNYLKAMRQVARLGTKLGAQGKKIEIMAPLLRMTKADIVKLGMKLKVPYSLTWSCYSGGKTPCGKCDSCILREKGFQESGQTDPQL